MKKCPKGVGKITSSEQSWIIGGMIRGGILSKMIHAGKSNVHLSILNKHYYVSDRVVETLINKKIISKGTIKKIRGKDHLVFNLLCEPTIPDKWTYTYELFLRPD